MLEMLNTFLTNEKKSFENFSIDISDKLVHIFFRTTCQPRELWMRGTIE